MGKEDPFGAEFAELVITEDRLTAVGSAPVPYRLDYELETGPGFVTTRLGVKSRGDGWARELDLRRDPDGAWDIATREDGLVDLPPPGGDPARLVDALDCDLGLSPVTNMMPILRHGLLQRGGPIELTMAWVAVPDLTVLDDQQRDAHVSGASGRHVVRYEAVDGSFAADITLDADAVVVDYPGIAYALGTC